jgi:hypothetical protein
LWKIFAEKLKILWKWIVDFCDKFCGFLLRCGNRFLIRSNKDLLCEVIQPNHPLNSSKFDHNFPQKIDWFSKKSCSTILNIPMNSFNEKNSIFLKISFRSCSLAQCFPKKTFIELWYEIWNFIKAIFIHRDNWIFLRWGIIFHGGFSL